MHFNLRHFVHSQHPITVEIVLLHPAVLERDRPIQHGSETESDAALHLRRNDIGIDGCAAVDRAHHTIHGNVTLIIDADLGHLRDEGLERLGHRDTATFALRHRRAAPAGLLGGELQDAFHARMVLEQPAPKRESVLHLLRAPLHR